MPLTQDEKNAKVLREQIAKIPENKRCADCTAKGPVYANTTFNTFVCTACSGIHREFNHRVKSISMASFKPDEVKGLLEGGNAVARQHWMARWSASDFPEPDPGDPERLRQFIRLKYIDKKWIAGGGSTTTPKKTSNKTKEVDNIPKPEPLTSILGNDIPPIQVRSPNNGTPPQGGGGGGGGWASFDNVNWSSGGAQSPSSAPRVATQNPPVTASLWDTPAPATASSGLEGLLFPSQEEVHKIEQEKQVKAQEDQHKKKSNDLLSQLGSMYQQQAQANQQQVLLQQQQMQQQMMLQMQQQMSQQQQGLTPQQQQLYMQQMQQMMRQFSPQQVPQQIPGQYPPQQVPQQIPFQNNFATQPIPFAQTSNQGLQGGFATSPTGFGGLASVGSSPFAEPPKQVEQIQPSKPDPFAALSPFSGGAPVKSSIPPKKPTTPTSQTNDPFGFGSSPAPVQNNNNMSDFFGGNSQPLPQTTEINPFGISQPVINQPVQKQDDFNPFF